MPDKAFLYLELVEAYKSADEMHEAVKIMQDALEFHGTTEEGHVTIAKGCIGAIQNWP